MINIQTFMLGLLMVSAITSLTTEAVKKILTDYNKKIPVNTLTGAIAFGVSIIFGVGYVIMAQEVITMQTIVRIGGLAFMSWLCAMVGYDKVVQTITQVKTSKGKDDMK